MDESSLRALEQHLLTQQFDVRERESLREEFARSVITHGLADSRNVKKIHTDALELLGSLYNTSFFDGKLLSLIPLRNATLRWRFSKRMTSTGGTTTRREYSNGSFGRRAEYEIAISSHLLFQSFTDPEKPEVVSGVRCIDRMDALQRIFEHELIHLAEMLVWYDSSCSAARFRGIAQRFFGHKESTHRLPRTEDKARTELGIRRGSRVDFDFEGRTYRGVVNRISRRATVLVVDPAGTLYSDGKRYRKFYVPVKMLRRAK